MIGLEARCVGSASAALRKEPNRRTPRAFRSERRPRPAKRALKGPARWLDGEGAGSASGGKQVPAEAARSPAGFLPLGARA